MTEAVIVDLQEHRLHQGDGVAEPDLRHREKTSAARASYPQEEAGELAATIGRNLRRLREESDWTLEQLAKLAGVNHTALQHIESARREPTIGELWKVSRILQVSCSSLLQRSESGETPAAPTRH